MTINYWPIKILLASENASVINVLVKRLLDDQTRDSTLKEIGCNLVNLTLFRLWQANLYHNSLWDNLKNFNKTVDLSSLSSPIFDKIIVNLKNRQMKTMSQIALREMAMHGLYDLFYSITNSPQKPIVIKGGASSLAFYPDKALRPSGDIDVLVPSHTVPLLVNNHDLDLQHTHHASPADCHNKEQIAKLGFYVEWHASFRHNMPWTFYDELLKHTVPLNENLLSVDAEHSLLIAAVHMFSHFGEMNSDLIDCSFISQKHNFSWQKVLTLAQNYRLEAELLSVTILLAKLGDQNASEISSYLENNNPRAKSLAKYFIRHMIAQNQNFWNTEFFYFKLFGFTAYSKLFCHRLIATFSYKNAWESPYTKKDPRFWITFLVVNPLKKATRLFGVSRQKLMKGQKIKIK